MWEGKLWPAPSPLPYLNVRRDGDIGNYGVSFLFGPLPRYGFVEFDDVRDADDAVYELNGKDLCGERVIVEHARGPRRDSTYGSGRSKH